MFFKSYKLLKDRFDTPAGTTVYDHRGHDYGLVSDDDHFFPDLRPHTMVTVNADGTGLGFTVPIAWLEELPGVASPSMDPPDDIWVKTKCLPGQGARTCRYLTMSSGQTVGWSCEKLGQLKQAIDLRVELEDLTARGNNCPGKGSRT